MMRQSPKPCTRCKEGQPLLLPGVRIMLAAIRAVQSWIKRILDSLEVPTTDFVGSGARLSVASYRTVPECTPGTAKFLEFTLKLGGDPRPQDGRAAASAAYARALEEVERVLPQCALKCDVSEERGDVPRELRGVVGHEQLATRHHGEPERARGGGDEREACAEALEELDAHARAPEASL